MSTKLPAYADKDLVATALLMGGMSPDRVGQLFYSGQDNPQNVIDNLLGSNDDATVKLAKLVAGYIANPGTGHLTDLLKNAGIDEFVIAKAINAVQGPNPNQTAPTPSAGNVLATIKALGGDPTGFVDRVNTGLQAVGAGTTGLTTTREQYLFPAAKPAAPATPTNYPAQDPNAGSAGTRVSQLGQLPTPPKPPPTPVTPAKAPAQAPAPTSQGPAPARVEPTDWAGKPIPKTPQELDDYMKANYGFATMALSDPDIAKILHDAAVGGWSPDKTKGLISTTTWWKNHTDADRQWLDLEKTDPATARKRQAMQLTDLQDIVAKSGETVDPRRLELISNLSLRHGWSTGQTAAALAAEYKYDPTGKVTGISADLKSQARNYATVLSDASFTKWGQQILAGSATMDTFKDYLSTQAKLLLPGLSQQIDQGFDVKTLIDPYMQRAAKLLDLDPNSMDFTDPKWLRFINARDPKGNVAPVNYADMEATIKTDPQYGWDKTKGAHEEAAQMSSTILSKFGMG